ncbi:MAG: ABC transporter substrate-binding protein [Wenzhouxiangella sp.]
MFVRIVLISAAAALFGGCGQPEEPARIGVLLWPPYELAYLAEAEDLLPDERFRLIDYQTPAEVLRAYRNGLIDGFFLTTQYAIGDHPDRPGTRIIHAINRSDGGDSLLAREGIESLDELAGRSLALEAGPLGAYMLQRVFDHCQLERPDLDLHFIDTPGHVDAFAGGRVDAVITYEPFRSRVKAAGGHDLFTSADIPGEIVDVLYVSGHLIEERHADLVGFVRGLEQARQLLEKQPESALPVMAERHRLSTEEFARALQGVQLYDLEQNLELLDGDPPLLAEMIARQTEVLRRTGMTVPERPRYARPDARIVIEAQP